MRALLLAAVLAFAACDPSAPAAPREADLSAVAPPAPPVCVAPAPDLSPPMRDLLPPPDLYGVAKPLGAACGPLDQCATAPAGPPQSAPGGSTCAPVDAFNNECCDFAFVECTPNFATAQACFNCGGTYDAGQGVGWVCGPCAPLVVK